MVVLPGHLLLGRYLRSLPCRDRLLLGGAAGVLAGPLVATLLALVHIPLEPSTYLFAVLLLALVADRVPGYRINLDELAELPVPMPLWTWTVAAGAVVVFGIVVIGGFGDYSVPPTAHDGANHAFMTQRICDTASYDLDQIFGEPWGGPWVLYLPGWHVAAAMIAGAGSLPAYVAMWMLAVTGLCMLPLAWTMLWRAWRMPAAVMAMAAWLVLANRDAPAGLLLWGGFGSMVGLSLVPMVALAFAQAVRRPTVGSAFVAGLVAAAMVHIYTADLVAAMVAAVVIVAVQHDRIRPRRWPLRASVMFVLTLVVFLGPGVWDLALSYGDQAMQPPLEEGLGLGRGLEVLSRTAGRWLPLRLLLILGVVAALCRRVWRPVALACLLPSLVVLGVLVWRDPATRLLAMPFYAQVGRILTLQMIFAPVLVALSLYLLATVGGGRGGRFLAVSRVVIVIAILVLAVRAELWTHTHRRLGGEWLRNQTVMNDDGYRVAARLATVVPDGDLVANSYDDGTCWASHLGGLRMVVPSGWIMEPPDRVHLAWLVPGLLEHPWSTETRLLAARGVSHVFVSNRTMGGGRTTDVDDFGADPRFQAVARHGDFAAFAIRWQDEGVSLYMGGSVTYGHGWGRREHWGRWAELTMADLTLEVPGDARLLVINTAPFEGQDGVQHCEVVAEGAVVGSFAIEGEAWEWQRKIVDIPADWAGRTVDVTLRFESSWKTGPRGDLDRACPVQSIGFE